LSSGPNFEFKSPGFQLFPICTHAYVDRGRFDGQDNRSNSTAHQVTPTPSLPFTIGDVRLRFDGFIDFIGSHGQCTSQILSQLTVKVDLGSIAGSSRAGCSQGSIDDSVKKNLAFPESTRLRLMRS
jgi:hypothetical protein